MEQLVKVKVGEKPLVKNGSTQFYPGTNNPIMIADTVSILTTGKTKNEVNARAKFLETISQTNGAVDTKALLKSGELQFRPGSLYVTYDIIGGVAIDQKIELLRKDRDYKNGSYSFIDGNKLQSGENFVGHGINFSVSDLTVDANGNVTAFSGANVITGQTSSATGTPDTSTQTVNSVVFTSGYSAPELQHDSGEILYVENRTKISRATDQTENIKLIIEF